MQGRNLNNTHLPRGSVPRGARCPPIPSRPPQNLLQTPEDSDDQEEIVHNQQNASGRAPSINLDGAVEYFGAVLSRDKDEEDNNGESVSGSPEMAQSQFGRSPPTQRKGPASGRRQQEAEESHAEDAEDGDSKETAFLGLFYQSGRLGCAVYDEVQAELSLLQIPETPEFDSLKLILYQVKPSLIVTNARPDRGFEDVLKNPSEDFHYDVSFAPTKEFKYEAAMSKLHELSCALGEQTGQDCTNENERMLRLGAFVDFDWKEAVMAAGGLLQHLEQNRMVEELQDRFVLAVTKIKTLQLQDYVHVDAQTLHSLQILHVDRHPSHYSKGKDKEGLSLFSLLDNTKSPLGRRLLKQWFVRPLMQEADIKARFDAVRFFVEPSNQSFGGSLHQALRQVKDVPRIMLRVRQSVASVSDWHNLNLSLKAMDSIHSACQDLHLPPGILEDVKTRFCDRVSNIVALLNGVINWEESKARKRVVVLEGVDDALDEEKSNYDKLGTYLEEIARVEVDDLPPDCEMRISVVFFPQLGYLVVAPNSGQAAPPGMTMHFNTEEWIYYKTERMRDLDSTVGDIYGRICDQEFAIMNEVPPALSESVDSRPGPKVREKVLEFHAELLESCSIAARLDCILGFAVAAVERDYCEPRLVQEAVCYFSEGRHPLCELCVDMYVPNDTCMDANRDGKSVLNIITGPNYSGKSVYLKQVALITFMAHLGSWVPARSCEVGLVDRIYSRVQSRESCAVPISSFAIDLNQVAVMLRGSTAKSLLLIDEFGKGTQASDGIALLASTIRHLLARENHCPRTVVATHFSELFTIGGILPESSLLGFSTMSVMGHDTRSTHLDLQTTPMSEPSSMELVYLYRLVDGKSCTSYGYQCAEQAGLPSQIVERAKLVSRQLRNNEPIERLEPEPEVCFRQRADDLVALLRTFNAETGDVKQFLQAVANTGRLLGHTPGSGHSSAW